MEMKMAHRSTPGNMPERSGPAEETAGSDNLDTTLDDASMQTFPASDPVSISPPERPATR
jgi:hypothetical protein